MSLRGVGLRRVRRWSDLGYALWALDSNANQQIGTYSNACRECPFARPGGGCPVANPNLIRLYRDMFFSDDRQPIEELQSSVEHESGAQFTHTVTPEGSLECVNVIFPIIGDEGFAANVTLRPARLHQRLLGLASDCIALRCYYPERGINDAHAIYAPL